MTLAKTVVADIGHFHNTQMWPADLNIENAAEKRLHREVAPGQSANGFYIFCAISCSFSVPVDKIQRSHALLCSANVTEASVTICMNKAISCWPDCH